VTKPEDEEEENAASRKKNRMSEAECLYHLKVHSNQTDAERKRSIGQQLGYMPPWQYCGNESIQHNMPMEYSLMVTSKTAVLLKVGRYHMQNAFDLETKKQLNA